jgi:hypothetical protein
MRHKPRQTATNRNDNDQMEVETVENKRGRRNSSATVESMSVEPVSVEPAPQLACEKQGGWAIVPNTELAVAEPTFMGLLHQAPR